MPQSSIQTKHILGAKKKHFNQSQTYVSQQIQLDGDDLNIREFS